jgi:small subunit ribosomal protein S20
MANIKSQIKRIKQNEVRRERNKAVRSELRTRTKRALSAIEVGADDLGESLRSAVARIDKAAQKGIIHPNQAARRKSRLMRHANTPGTPVVAAPKAAPATKAAPTKAAAKKSPAKKAAAKPAVAVAATEETPTESAESATSTEA